MPFFFWLPMIIWSGMCSVAQDEAREREAREQERAQRRL